MQTPTLLLSKLLAQVAKQNATSLHLSVGSFPLLKVDGHLQALDQEPIVTIDLINDLLQHFLNETERQRLQAAKELVVVKNLDGQERFKISIFYQKNTPTLTFYPVFGSIRPLADLGLPQSVKKFLSRQAGLLVLTGPQGSGKTSTAASIIEEINQTRKVRILTLEDPIERLFLSKKSLIEQRQIGRDTPSFTNGLIYCLEEDVDVVYVGEIKKDLDLALPPILELAAGNALVILEFNAADSVAAIEKMLRYLSKRLPVVSVQHALADVLFGCLAHKLVPRRGGGLALALEIMIVNSVIASLLREGKILQIKGIIPTARKEGMRTLRQALDDLIASGKVRGEDVI